MKIKTSDLTGTALDWAVGYIMGEKLHILDRQIVWPEDYSPSTDWAQGGPLIEREKLTLTYDDDWKYDPTDPEDNGERWMATNGDVYDSPCQYGATPLIAAMRCYVSFKLGDEVEIPEELK